METRANHLLVGAFVICLFTAGFGFVIWLSKVEFEEPSRYVVEFTGSVTGLSIGSPVRMRGVPVGSVSDIRIDPTNIERILVTIEVSPATPIKVDTVATLGLQGITGVAFIHLDGGTQDSARLEKRPGQALPVIPSHVSGLQQVLDKAPEVFEKAIELADRLTRLVSDRNLEAVARTLENLEKVSGTLGAQGSDFETLLRDTGTTVVALRRVADSLDLLATELRSKTGPLADEAGKVLVDAQETMSDIRQATKSLSEVAQLLEVVVKENRGPVRDFSNAGLYELTQFITEARTLVNGLTRLSAQIERNPARFFFGDTQKGFRPN